MNVESLLFLALAASMAVFFVQCMTMLKLNIDAGYIVGFAVYFDMFGYFYKQYVPTNSFVLLIAAPLLPVCLALLKRSARTEGLLTEPGLWVWGLFLLYSVTALSWASHESDGMMKEQILFIRGVIPGIYAYIIYKKYKTFSWTVVALFGLAYAVMHLLLGGYTSEFPGRLTMPGGNPIYDSRIAFFTIAVCLWGRNIHPVIRLVVIAVALVSGLYTQSRGPLVAFVLVNVLVFALVLIQKYRKGELKVLARYAVPLCFAILFVLFGSYLYVGHSHEWLDSSRFTVLFDRDQLQADDNYLGRLNLQKEALARFMEHPFFGAGLGASSPGITHDHPHNVIIEMASELGIIGLILWFGAFLFSIWMASKNHIMLVLLLQTFGYAQMSGDFGYNYEYILMAFVAMALVPKKEGTGREWHAENTVSHYRI